MPTIIEEVWYDGARERIERLGLISLTDEIKSAITGFDLRVKESRDANSGAVVRRMIDAQIERIGGWTKKVTGDMDWFKCHTVNGTKVSVRRRPS
jgi:hypothetical protein